MDICHYLKKKIKKTFLVKQKANAFPSFPLVLCYKPRKVTSIYQLHACNRSVSILLCQQHFYLQHSKPN